MGKTWFHYESIIFDYTRKIINTGKTIIMGVDRGWNSIGIEFKYEFSFVVSKDNGINWDTIRPPYQQTSSFYQYKNYVFATLNDDIGILRSSDYGYTWEKASFGINSVRLDYINVNRNLKILEANNQQKPFWYNNKYFRIKNNGKWEKYEDTLFMNNSGYLLTDDKILFKSNNGVYLSNDNGDSWDKQNSKNFNGYLCYTNNLLIVSDSNHIYRSLDLGKTWEKSSGQNVPFLNSYLYNLTYCNNEYYARLGDSVIKSTNEGFTWKIPSTPKIFYFVSNNNYIFGYTYSNLYRKKSNIEIWDTLKFPQGLGKIEYFKLYTMNNDLYCAVRSEVTTNQITNRKSMIFKSIDNGETWQDLEITFSNEEAYFNMFFTTFYNNIFYTSEYLNFGIWTLDLSKTDVENDIVNQQNELAVYPNPSQGKFTIERRNVQFSSNLPVKYCLKSITGQEVLSLISSDEKLEIKTDNFPSGIYYLIAEQNSSNIIQMITIAK